MDKIKVLMIDDNIKLVEMIKEYFKTSNGVEISITAKDGLEGIEKAEEYFKLENLNDINNSEIVHHIIPIKQRPDLALDINNMVSLSFEAHEIIEERTRFRYKRKKKITQERW